MARSVFEREWNGARAARTSAPVAEGDIVRVRGKGVLGTVRRVTAHLGEHDVLVDLPTGLQTLDALALERVEGDPRDPEFWISQPPGTSDDLALTLTWTKLTHPLTDTVYSFASSKTVFRAYQFAPVLKLLDSATGRLLIADEVGLGKTIEAGLIWSELEQRTTLRQLDRVLVVAPASLALKWKSEMARRFDRDLTVMKPNDLLVHAHDMAEGREARFAGVVSLESLRTADSTLQALSEVHARFDLVIVDEAHALRNRSTRAYELGQLLSDWADVLIFLSATPLNLGRSDLFNLVNMLREDEFSDETIFEAQLEPNQALNEVARRLRRDRSKPRKLLRGPRAHPGHGARAVGGGQAGLPAPGRSARLRRPPEQRGGRAGEARDVQPQHAGQRADAHPQGRRPRRQGGAGRGADRRGLDRAGALHVRRDPRPRPERDACSGGPAGLRDADAAAAGGILPASDAALAAFAATGATSGPTRSRTGADDVDDDLDLKQVLPPTAWRGSSPPSSATRSTRRWSSVCSGFASQGHAPGHGLLVLPGHAAVPRGAAVAADVGTADDRRHARWTQRQQVMEDFRAGKFDVLLLSQVGAEGLDFEFCNVLVNYDLPWNPMQVEQRIGRLDRFGQTQRTHLHLQHARAGDDRVRHLRAALPPDRGVRGVHRRAGADPARRAART